LPLTVAVLNENACAEPTCGVPILVDDDRRGQPVEQVDVGAGLAGHEALQERRVGLVDQPLGLRGDGGEHQGALARAGHPGEDREPALGDLEVDVLEVVLARAEHADEVMAVGGVLHGVVHTACGRHFRPGHTRAGPVVRMLCA
jgi:hypothetical protein